MKVLAGFESPFSEDIYDIYDINDIYGASTLMTSSILKPFLPNTISWGLKLEHEWGGKHRQSIKIFFSL